MSEEYLLGLSIKESMNVLVRNYIELFDIVIALQNRVLELELNATKVEVKE